jgi:hypothetical protein
MAIWRRADPDSLLHHSITAQYTSEQFERLMADPRYRLLDEPLRRRLGHDGEVLPAEDRTRAGRIARETTTTWNASIIRKGTRRPEI